MYAVKCNACHRARVAPTSAHQSRELLRFDIERDQRDGLLQLYADAEVAITTAGSAWHHGSLIRYACRKPTRAGTATAF